MHLVAVVVVVGKVRHVVKRGSSHFAADGRVDAGDFVVVVDVVDLGRVEAAVGVVGVVAG